jgi:putative membrane protein insertion efficiency factor
MRFFFCLIAIAGLSVHGTAQQVTGPAVKHSQLEAELNALEPERPSNKKGLANAMLTFYQRHISSLISADCLYSLSCSRYSRKAIRMHGFTKGVLLTADRLSRCAAFCGRDIPAYLKNDEGLAEDNP